MRRYLATFVIVVSLAVTVFGADLYIPKQQNGKIITHEAELKPKPDPIRTMISQKNLLGLERDKPYGLPVKKHGKPIPPVTADVQVPDIINVLVLRIEFLTEEPDDPTTTGNGNFDLRSFEDFVAEEGHEFDPAPHNRAYFNAHMEALDNYWGHVSDNRLDITWDIYPETENGSYRLPHPMSYYGSDVPGSELVGQLLKFIRDGVTMVDTLNPEIDFSQYQSIIIFHAGSNQQNNFDFIEDTPNDFWTGFLWTEDTVWVDNGSTPVTEVIIMPETGSQDNRVTVINGVMAHEFGHQLGLVDIYNTTNFLTQVGNFSLMDNNCANIALQLDEQGTFVMGALPCYPDAWSRAYLGFSGVTEVVSADDITIRAAEQGYFYNEVIKVPISEMEYFLIENRQTKTDFDYTHVNYLLTDNAILADPATSVIIGPGWAHIANNDTVKVSNGEYDRLLPGDGLLIWHVDELVAHLDYTGTGYNNFKLNTLQWDHNRRFLSLVEADGIIDFGGNYHSGYGSEGDYFNDRRTFTPSTNPSTESTLGADTHISITDITSPYNTTVPGDRINRYSDTVMTIDVNIDWHQEGFPTMGFPDPGDNGGGLLAIDMNADGVDEIITARGSLLIGVNGDGSPVMDTSSGVIIPNFDNDTLIYVIPYFAQLNSNIMGDLIGGDFDGDDTLELACFDDNNEFYIYEGHDLNPVDSAADLLHTRTLSATPVTDPLAYDIGGDGNDDVIVGLNDSTICLISYSLLNPMESDVLANLNGLPMKLAVARDTLFAIYVSAGNNRLFVGAFNDSIFEEVTTIDLPDGDVVGLVSGDINRDLSSDVVMTIGDYLCLYDGAERSLNTISVVGPGAPSIGDIDANGYPDIALTSTNGSLYLYAYNHLGKLMNNFPVVVSTKCYTRCYNEPLLADFDDDNKPDIIVTLPNGSLGWDVTMYVQQDTTLVPVDTTLALPTGGLTCFNYNGDRLGGFPLPTSTAISVEPAIGNFDTDSTFEIAAIDSAGFFAVWDLEVAPDSIDMPWRSAGGGYARAGYLQNEYNKPIEVAQVFLDEAMVYNYPNPAKNSTTFRYYVDRPAEVNIKIFDMTGELVDEINGSTPGQVDDEIIWDCTEFASGVYYARFEADDGSANKNVMIKVALIK